MSLTDLSIWAILFVCAGVFCASFVDAIAGGGGIIALPVYIISGLPAHMAIGTNKFSSTIGTSVSTIRYIRNGYADLKLALPCILIAIPGGFVGTKLQLMVDENYLKFMLIFLLPVVAFVILKQKSFPEEPDEISPVLQKTIVYVSTFIVSVYDGFYGPGTGTFLLLAFCNLGKLDVRTASGNMKIVNFSSNIGALISSFFAHKIFFTLGAIASVFSIAGHYIGSGLTIRNGSRIVRPVIILVLILLLVKVLWEFVF